MRDEMISLETSELAQRKGFDRWKIQEPIHNMDDIEVWPEVTQSLLQRWLREVHNMFITIEQDFERVPNAKPMNKRGDTLMQHSGRYFLIVRPPNTINPPNSTFANTYEEALEKGLIQALNLLEDANNTKTSSNNN